MSFNSISFIIKFKVVEKVSILVGLNIFTGSWAMILKYNTAKTIRYHLYKC